MGTVHLHVETAKPEIGEKESQQRLAPYCQPWRVAKRRRRALEKIVEANEDYEFKSCGPTFVKSIHENVRDVS
jgi:hypothetical protein